MKRYYTSLDIANDMFVATVFDANTNQELFKSRPYHSQAQAMTDVNTYIRTQRPPEAPANRPRQSKPVQQTIVNTAVQRAVPGSPRRCCGR